MKRTSLTHIESTADVAGGRPRITGTRVRVQDVVLWTELGRSPDEIVSGHPHITLSDVYAALAYYHDHREEIDSQIKNDDDFVEHFREQYLSRNSNRADDANPLPPR